MSQDEFNRNAFFIAEVRDMERNSPSEDPDKFYTLLFEAWAHQYPADVDLPKEILIAVIALEDTFTKHMKTANDRRTWFDAFLRVSAHFRSNGEPIDEKPQPVCPPCRARAFYDAVPVYMRSIVEQRMPVSSYEAMRLAERHGQLPQ